MGDQFGEDHPYMNVFFKEMSVQVKESGGIGLKTGDIICLLADNNKYLSRINRSLNPIEAAKLQIDPYCKFKVTVLDGSTIALLADNNKYLSRINHGSDPIEAAKPQIDPSCKFKVTFLDGDTIVPFLF
jgi:hypothetical protein